MAVRFKATVAKSSIGVTLFWGFAAVPEAEPHDVRQVPITLARLQEPQERGAHQLEALTHPSKAMPRARKGSCHKHPRYVDEKATNRLHALG